MSKKSEDIIARMDETYRKAGAAMWETPAGAHAVKLLAVQEAVTIDDIVASLEREGTKDRRLKAMNESVIASLRNLQTRRQSD